MAKSSPKIKELEEKIQNQYKKENSLFTEKKMNQRFAMYHIIILCCQFFWYFLDKDF